ncbi:hypothetical protein DFS34DRAFT_692709 [Phlyctochytrium arcticum]|nr:hypothetical protein DFS34DRAFT_692709 [Phlyctochytrium arcticum]
MPTVVSTPTTTLLTFPPEILTHVFSHLSLPQRLLLAGRVCKTWNDIAFSTVEEVVMQVGGTGWEIGMYEGKGGKAGIGEKIQHMRALKRLELRTHSTHPELLARLGTTLPGHPSLTHLTTYTSSVLLTALRTSPNLTNLTLREDHAAPIPHLPRQGVNILFDVFVQCTSRESGERRLAARKGQNLEAQLKVVVLDAPLVFTMDTFEDAIAEGLALRTAAERGMQSQQWLSEVPASLPNHVPKPWELSTLTELSFQSLQQASLADLLTYFFPNVLLPNLTHLSLGANEGTLPETALGLIHIACPKLEILTLSGLWCGQGTRWDEWVKLLGSSWKGVRFFGCQLPAIPLIGAGPATINHGATKKSAALSRIISLLIRRVPKIEVIDFVDCKFRWSSNAFSVGTPVWGGTPVNLHASPFSPTHPQTPILATLAESSSWLMAADAPLYCPSLRRLALKGLNTGGIRIRELSFLSGLVGLESLSVDNLVVSGIHDQSRRRIAPLRVLSPAHAAVPNTPATSPINSTLGGGSLHHARPNLTVDISSPRNWQTTHPRHSIAYIKAWNALTSTLPTGVKNMDITFRAPPSPVQPARFELSQEIVTSIEDELYTMISSENGSPMDTISTTTAWMPGSITTSTVTEQMQMDDQEHVIYADVHVTRGTPAKSESPLSTSTISLEPTPLPNLETLHLTHLPSHPALALLLSQSNIHSSTLSLLPSSSISSAPIRSRSTLPRLRSLSVFCGEVGGRDTIQDILRNLQRARAGGKVRVLNMKVRGRRGQSARAVSARPSTTTTAASAFPVISPPTPITVSGTGIVSSPAPPAPILLTIAETFPSLSQLHLHGFSVPAYPPLSLPSDHPWKSTLTTLDMEIDTLPNPILRDTQNDDVVTSLVRSCVNLEHLEVRVGEICNFKDLSTPSVPLYLRRASEALSPSAAAAAEPTISMPPSYSQEGTDSPANGDTSSMTRANNLQKDLCGNFESHLTRCAPRLDSLQVSCPDWMFHWRQYRLRRLLAERGVVVDGYTE